MHSCIGHDHKFMKVDDVVIHPNPPKLGATVDIQATIETCKFKYFYIVSLRLSL